MNSNKPGPKVEPARHWINGECIGSFARIDRLVEEAKQYAQIIVRGGPIVEGPLAPGAFYRPSMLETEALDVPLVQEQIFGPVLSFEAFATEDEAIARANATIFGLAAAVFTMTSTVNRESPALSRPARCGPTPGILNDAFEEGGFKYSGIGRARGLRAMEEFQEVKTQIRSVARAPAARSGTQTA